MTSGMTRGMTGGMTGGGSCGSRTLASAILDDMDCIYVTHWQATPPPLLAPSPALYINSSDQSLVSFPNGRLYQSKSWSSHGAVPEMLKIRTKYAKNIQKIFKKCANDAKDKCHFRTQTF
jgi:hypothetical protein